MKWYAKGIVGNKIVFADDTVFVVTDVFEKQHDVLVIDRVFCYAATFDLCLADRR